MYDLNYHGTANLPQESLEPLPDLCHKCGKCCRSATTFHPYKKLLEMAANGDKEAQDFLEIFEPYKSHEEAAKVEPEQVQRLLEVVANRDDMKVEEVTFYHCRYVTPEGLCGIYERRPRCCKEAPSNGWSAMPPGCGFEGWQFEQREKHKRMIRELKTVAYGLAKLSPDGVTHPSRPDTTLADVDEMIEEKIKPWKTYGADYW